MEKQFEVETFGAPKEWTINLTRNQIEQMAKVINNFKEIDSFQLRVMQSNGIGPTVHFAFDLDLTDTNNW
jgi:hypothetical protein